MSIRRLDSGKYRVQIRRTTGFYKAGSFPDLATANEAIRQWNLEADQAARGGLQTVPPGTTLADAVRAYVKHNAATAKWGRTKTYSLTLLENDAIGAVPLAKLNSMAIRQFVDRRLKTSGGVSVTIYLSNLSSVLKWLRHARGWNIDPDMAMNERKALAYRPGVQTRSKVLDRLPTDAEMEALYAYWESKPRMKINMPLLCKFLMASCLRIGEAQRITVQDVDREKKTVIVRDRKLPNGKWGNHVAVPLVMGSYELIEPLIEGRTKGQIFQGLQSRSASTAFTRACKALGFEKLNLHALRHYGVTACFRNGLDAQSTARVSGHRTAQQLARYSHVTAEDVFAKLETYAAMKKQALEAVASS